MDSTSTLLMDVLIAAPMVDSIYVAGIRNHNSEVALQTSLINLESYALTAFLTGMMKSGFARERPYLRNCPGDPSCGSKDDNMSFPSGHTSFAFTAAGLMCTHHAYLPLYGKPKADEAACITAMTLATLTGGLRIVSDKHYAADVGMGAAIGLFSGMVLPRMLHYGWRGSNPEQTDSQGSTPGESKAEFLVSPFVMDKGSGLAFRALF